MTASQHIDGVHADDREWARRLVEEFKYDSGVPIEIHVARMRDGAQIRSLRHRHQRAVVAWRRGIAETEYCANASKEISQQQDAIA